MNRAIHPVRVQHVVHYHVRHVGQRPKIALQRVVNVDGAHGPLVTRDVPHELADGVGQF